MIDIEKARTLLVEPVSFSDGSAPIFLVPFDAVEAFFFCKDGSIEVDVQDDDEDGGILRYCYWKLLKSKYAPPEGNLEDCLIRRLSEDPDFIRLDESLGDPWEANIIRMRLNGWMDACLKDGRPVDDRATLGIEALSLIENGSMTNRSGDYEHVFLRKSEICGIQVLNWEEKKRSDRKFVSDLYQYINIAKIFLSSDEFVFCNRFQAQELIERLAEEGARLG